MKVSQTKAVCRYAAMAYAGKNDCPPCSGTVNFRIRGFFMGDARKLLGPDMRLCEGHAKWLREVNPCHKIVEG